MDTDTAIKRAFIILLILLVLTYLQDIFFPDLFKF
jgi:hypothetical protein